MKRPRTAALSATLLVAALLAMPLANRNRAIAGQTHAAQAQALDELRDTFELISQEPALPATILTQGETRIQTLEHLQADDPQTPMQIHALRELAADSARDRLAVPRATYDELLVRLGRLQDAQIRLEQQHRADLQQAQTLVLASRVAAALTGLFLLAALL